MITFNDKKITAKQWAAAYLYYHLDAITGYWSESVFHDRSKATQKELDDISDQMTNFHNRIIRLVEKSVPKELL